MRISDWISDVCSSDLGQLLREQELRERVVPRCFLPLLSVFAGQPGRTDRSEERHVGQEGVTKCRSRWRTNNKKNKKNDIQHENNTTQIRKEDQILSMNINTEQRQHETVR